MLDELLCILGRPKSIPIVYCYIIIIITYRVHRNARNNIIKSVSVFVLFRRATTATTPRPRSCGIPRPLHFTKTTTMHRRRTDGRTDRPPTESAPGKRRAGGLSSAAVSRIRISGRIFIRILP